MLNDQRAEIKELKHRLSQGEEAARNGNVWLEVVNFATNESEFVNPFEGRKQERMPKGFVSNYADMKKAAKEAIKTRVQLRKAESRVRELDVRAAAGLALGACTPAYLALTIVCVVYVVMHGVGVRRMSC